MSEWISVDDRLPECGTTVIVCGDASVDSAFLTTEETESWDYTDKDTQKRSIDTFSWWTFLNADYIEVTFWQPLPAPPEA